MVFVNDKKFACESCVKGHRSSSCHHTDRPLFEIKKKGRPVSQCATCRELRKTKRVHNKCECSSQKTDKVPVKQLSGKSKRYIPILPTLPNGLKDALTNKNEAGPSDPRGKVDILLNPCACKDVWNCKCRPSDEASSSRNTGLDTLASAAAMCCGTTGPTNGASSNANIPGPEPATDDHVSAVPQKHPRSCCQRPSSPSSPPPKRRKGRAHSPKTDPTRGPSLPPILASPVPNVAPPTYPEIPPLQSIASLAGTGCTCGFDCSCPGCVEHRGPQHASKEHEDCPDCGTCVDHSHASGLPSSAAFGSALPSSSSIVDAGPSFIDAFFARAAATIPPPPSQRASAAAGAFDPSNITVYPRGLFTGEKKRLDEHGPAFGLVRLPKLECCAGRCGCAGETCGCGKDCNGCCAGDDVVETESAPKEVSPVLQENQPKSPTPAPAEAPVRSCCAGKKA